MTDQILRPHNFTTRELEILNKHLERFPFIVENEQIKVDGKWEDTGNLALDDYAQICTDGDHITKEHTRVQNIKNAGYNPIRVMFYFPNRQQAIRIQNTIKTIYEGMGGHYYFAEDAWSFIEEFTGIDLLAILERIADSKVGEY